MDEKGALYRAGGVIHVLMTREMDYGLRILRALHQSGQLSASVIAQQEHMPRAVTLKILKQFHKAGLVDSRRGPSGGYLLGQPCEQLNLWDLFRALGEPLYLNRCQQPGYQCENHPDGGCGLHQELSRIQQVLEGELRKTTLSDIFRSQTKSK